jgi:hypothetical protein
MRKNTSIAVLVAFFSFAAFVGAARATPTIATSQEPPEPMDRRTEINLGMLLGGSDVGQSSRGTFGIQVDIGRRFGDLVLLGEYGYLSVGEGGGSSPGSLSRLGVTARYSLLRTSGAPNRYGRRKPVSGDYWMEAGAGMQRITWDTGGVLTRPDLVLGFGWQLDVVLGRRSAHPRYYGPYVAFRANLSRAPDSTVADLPATCGGPCDTATRPSQNDVGLFFHFGVNWGRES